MPQPKSIKPAAPLEKLVLGVRRRRTLRRLAKRLHLLSESELDDLLAGAGLTRADLFTRSTGNAHHRRLMAHMLAHFNIDLETACEHSWSELLRAEEACQDCRTRSRCRRWFAWGLNNDAPSVFCGNAERFRDIQFNQQRVVQSHSRGFALATTGATAPPDDQTGNPDIGHDPALDSLWQSWLSARLDDPGDDRTD